MCCFYHVPDDSWQEETVTWNNAPAADPTLLAQLGAVSPNTWYEVDVTSLVTGDGTYSFRISDSVGGADYSSKEGANDPELVLTLGGTPVATNTPTNTATPGPSPTPTHTSTPTIAPTATTPPAAPFNNAIFVYDGDGKRVKSIFNGTTTTYFVGNHFEVTGSSITKYYYAGSQRIAMRTNGTLRYILTDHLGSTSLTTDANGQNITETYYKAWGEVRYASDVSPTKYQYTGQYSYATDFGLLFYNARWYDSELGRFAQADNIIPEQTQGVQAWDRYAYTNNNPLNFIDPSGHKIDHGCNTEGCDFHTQPAPGVSQEQHDRLRALLEEAELMSTLMHLGEITDIEALARILEFAVPMYGEDVDGFLTDLGIVVGGLDTTGLIPRQIDVNDPNEPLLQYYIGYPAFNPDQIGFSPELNPRNQNQVRHFLAGAAGGNAAIGGLGRMFLLWQEREPEDDLLYRRAFAFADFLAEHPLGQASDWIWENLAP